VVRQLLVASCALLAGCAGTLRFDLEVCRLADATGDELRCQRHGRIVAPFSRDHRSEVNALGLSVCGEGEPRVTVEDLHGDAPLPTQLSHTSPGGVPCTAVEWHRDVAHTTYRVVIECETCTEPLEVRATAAEAVVGESFEVAPGPARTVALLIVSPPGD
jgi:hypothetical protein